MTRTFVGVVPASLALTLGDGEAVRDPSTEEVHELLERRGLLPDHRPVELVEIPGGGTGLGSPTEELGDVTPRRVVVHAGSFPAGMDEAFAPEVLEEG